jgi:polar amino acid transport system substrate-binding protein
MKAFAVLAAMACCASASAAAEAPIRLLYQERPPYQMLNGHAVEGLTASPAAAAFAKAGIAFVWQPASMSRQMTMLREAQTADCVCGWLKTSERLAFAKYTRPIHRDSPMVGLARADYIFGRGDTLAQALATPGLRMLVRDKYSYGELVDRMFERLKPDLIRSNLSNLKLTDLITAGRADLMLAGREEADVLLRQAASSPAPLRMVQFSDITRGEERHIVCSRKVPDEIIERLNKALAPAH